MNYEMEKISELDTLSTADNGDILVINDVSEGDTMKITKQNFLKEVYDSLALKANAIDLQNAIMQIMQLVYSKTAVDGLIQKHILTATISSDMTLTNTSDTPINLVLNNSVGSKLSVSNGGIVIGSGVSKVLVSAKANFNVLVSSNTQRYFKVKKNNTEVLVSRNASPSNTNGLALPITPSLIDVVEGDVFTISVQGVSGDVLRSTNVWTNVTIEVVE